MDLYTNVTISLQQALSGFEMDISLFLYLKDKIAGFLLKILNILYIPHAVNI